MTRGVGSAATRTIRFWAGVDLVATSAFAFPPVVLPFVSLLYHVNGMLGGADTPPAFLPLHLFFACLAGALGVLWAVVRLAWPQRSLARADAFGRLWVAGLILYFVTIAGAPLVLLVFVISELAGSLHQFLVLRRRS